MGAVIEMVLESAIHLSDEAGICRGQLGRAGERLNRIQCADGVLMVLGRGFPPSAAMDLPTSCHLRTPSGMWNPSCLKSLIRRVPARLRDHCQFVPFGQPQNGCRVSVFWKHSRATTLALK